MKKSQYLVIVNPAANRGDAAKKIPALESLLNSRKVNYQMLITKKPGEATNLAKQAAKKRFKAVIAAGGDGTANEIANGLAKSNCPLGVIPMGSGNDFSKGLVLRKSDWQFNLDVIIRGRTKKIDLGLINGRYFVNCVGLGFIGQINEFVKKSPAYLRGYTMYFYSVLRIIKNYYPYRFKICMKETGGQKKYQQGLYSICEVSNGKYVGGGFQLTPNAITDDGLLDVCLADQLSRGYILRLLPLIMQGKHLGKPKIHFFQVKKIKVESDKIIPLQVDGEVMSRYKQIEIKVIPQALTVITNE